MTANTDDDRVTDAIADLRAWSDALPAYDVVAGVARHGELLARGTVAVDATAVVRGSRRGWWIAGGTAMLAIGLVGAWPREPHAPGAEPAFPAASRAPASVASADRVAVAAPVIDEPIAEDPGVDDPRVDEITVAPKPRVGRPRGAGDRKPSAATSAPADPPDALEHELAVVRRMRRALAEEPRRVLELAAAADRELGPGVFAEERAALRVFALDRLDDARTDAAAAAFLREFGEGPFAARVARVAGNEATTTEPQ